jgi:hypothetical protein
MKFERAGTVLRHLPSKEGVGLVPAGPFSSLALCKLPDWKSLHRLAVPRCFRLLHWLSRLDYFLGHELLICRNLHVWHYQALDLSLKSCSLRSCLQFSDSRASLSVLVKLYHRLPPSSEC